MAKYNDAVLAVTYQCNSKCRMCNIWKMKHVPALELNEYKKLPKTLKTINISGGEPFLRPDLPELIKIIKKTCPNAQIIISSNGFATDLIIDQMKKILKIDSRIGIALSLDGIGITHEKVRGIPGGYDKVLKTLKGLKDLGITNLRFAFTAGDYNIDDLNKVYDLAEDEGIEFTLAALHNAENYFQTTDNKIDAFDKFKKEFCLLIKKELKKANPKRWLRAFFAYGLLQFVLTGKRILPCYSGVDSFFLDPLGNVYPCDVSSQKLGNLKKIKNFNELKKVQKDKGCTNSWMICTVRTSIKKHPVRVGLWILKSKLFGIKI